MTDLTTLISAPASFATAVCFCCISASGKKYSLRQIAARASMSKSSVWRIVHGRRAEKIRKRKGQHGKSGRQKILTSPDKKA